MAKVSVSEAARIAKISRSYLYRKYITTGKISVEKDREDKPVIDTSEIIRVFGDRQLEVNKGYHPDPAIKDSKIALLEAEVRLKDELLKAKDNHISDLQQTLRLLEQRAAAEPAAKGFSLFGMRFGGQKA